ncbi:hypothetical protein [Microcoleus sp. F4-D5]|uniref:hypothetical protein n=1 Tax=Microcoleus sp. F4-D5 TaxID=2818760 RepID=UPI002FD6CD55
MIIFPTLNQIFSAPVNRRLERVVAATILDNSFSVACSSRDRVLALSSAKYGWRQAINLSPG